MNYDLYVVTDDRLSNGKSHVEVARLAYEGGADIVQLRVKDRDERFIEWADRISEISKHYGRTFIVNDDIDIAIKSNADGIHVGQDDMPVNEIRKIVPADFIVGVSVSDVYQAVEAEKNGATYVALSPIFDTASKSDAGRGHGLEILKRIRQSVSIPVIAIGGINKDNIPSIIENGADGIAVISAVVSQPDITKAAAELRSIVTASKARR